MSKVFNSRWINKESEMGERRILIILIMSVLFLCGMGKRLLERKILYPHKMRIGVLIDVTKVKISSSGNLQIIPLDLKQPSIILKPKSQLEVKPFTEGIKVNDKEIYSDSLKVKSSAFIKVERREYRGEIKILKKDDKLTVVNELGIEEYLYGVIKEEISPSWPLETLKAQAVAARTFMLKNLGKYEKEGFDLCATVHSQVYGGVNSEAPRSIQAVDLTKGEILTYKGEVIFPPYHATCGGYTEDPRNVWSGRKKFPYLRSLPCNFCKDSPHYRWTAALSLKEIEKILKGYGLKIGKVLSLKLIKCRRSKRVKKICIKHTQGKTYISSNDFRLACGPEVIRSTLFNISQKSPEIKFKGKGWGHSVGLCQWGARGMALKGYNYKEILKYYYPGTKIINCRKRKN